AQSTPPPALSGSVRLQADLKRPAQAGRYFGLALLAATLMLVVGGITIAFRFRPAASGWEVTTAEGRSTLTVGNWLETGARARATVDVANIGQLTIEPNTRLRLLTTRAGDHRLALARGTLHARIWAPPNQFFVETPSTLAVDLGCAYTLTMDDEGAGLVNVLVGWVGFK